MTPGLIFDLDGTLVDSLPGITASLNRALAEHGLPVHSSYTVRGFIGNGSRVLVERAVSDPTRVERVEAAFKADYDASWPDGTTAYPGLAPLLSALGSEGFPLAVLSNKPHPFTVAMVSRLFPEVRFASVLGQRPGIPHKPDPGGAFEISMALNRRPADCIIIGDSTMDLETASAAGMPSVAVAWGYHDPERLTAAGYLAWDADQLAARLRASI